MRGQNRTAERIASRQHGNATRAQLLEAGLSSSAIERRIASGYLLPTYPGVYRVGHRAPGVDAHCMAAVLACGDRALLYGMAAAFLHRLLRGDHPPPPEVLTPTERRIEGIATRRCRDIGSVRATRVRGIPVITVPEVLVAVAPRLTADELARICHEAGVRHGTTPGMVEAVLNRRPRPPGAAALRAVMAGDVKVSLSKLESEFLRRLGEAGLPLPSTNRAVGRYRVDCRWHRQRLTVELDSFRFHNSRHSWEQGHRREREARARGDEFRRYAWFDVVEDPGPMLAELRGLLTTRPG